MEPFLEAQAYAGTHEPQPATETQHDLTTRHGKYMHPNEGMEQYLHGTIRQLPRLEFCYQWMFK